MKILVLLLLGLVVASAAQNHEWNRQTIDLNTITQQVNIHKSETEFSVKVRQCPSELYCIETVRLEILEMECYTNATDSEPDYLIFQGFSNVTGEVKEKKVTKCADIPASKPLLIDFGAFEAEDILIRPFSSNDRAGWDDGTVWAKIQIVSEIKSKVEESEGLFDWNFRIFRNEVIYLEMYIRNIFLFTSFLTILAVALLLTYFTLKINKMFKTLARRSTPPNLTTATGLPPAYHDLSNLPQYQQSKF